MCVITTASENPCCDADSGWSFYSGMFTRYGAGDVRYINVTMPYRSNAFDNETTLALIRSCDGFWFGGGDQTKIMAAWFDNVVDSISGENTRIPSPAIQALFDRFEVNGGVIAGHCFSFHV